MFLRTKKFSSNFSRLGMIRRLLVASSPGFEVSMQNAPGMHVVKGREELNGPVKDLFFAEFFVFFFELFEANVQITALNHKQVET